MVYGQIKYLNAVPGYAVNLLMQTSPFYHTDLKDSLEGIVTKEKPETGGLLGKVFADKSKILKATVKALFNEVTLREKMNL
jgi:hypothetical protein